MKMNPVYDLDTQEYNLKLAEALKKIPEFKKPEWVEFVKSGPAKERPIEDPLFFLLPYFVLNRLTPTTFLRYNCLRILAALLCQKSGSSIGLSFAGPDFTNSTHSGFSNSEIFLRASANLRLYSCVSKS